MAADGRGHIVTANPAARRLLGYGPTEPLPDLPELFRVKAAREVVDAVLEGDVVQNRQLEMDDRVFLMNARPLPTGGAVLVLHDLTETRRLEAVRRDFVANVSHELKTPLTSISGYAETLLGDSADPEMAQGFLRTILSNARRMTAPLLVRLGARDRELMLRCVIPPTAPRRSRLAWTAITHLGGTGTSVAAAAVPWFGCCELHAGSRVALTTLVTSHVAVQLVKRTVVRARPGRVGPYAAVREPDRFSFPSGHAAAAMPSSAPSSLSGSPVSSACRSAPRRASTARSIRAAG